MCEYAESFSDEPVGNFTGVSPATATITSTPSADDTYVVGDIIRVRLTFSEAVNVTGAPRLKIGLGSEQGRRWAYYESGSGTNSLTFAYRVGLRNTSPRGIAVLSNTLDLKYGALRYASSGEPAYLAHTGLGHDADHKVDWRLPPPGIPWISSAAVTSEPGRDDTYGLDDTIRVTLTLSEAVDVTGAPRLKFKMNPDQGQFWADYESGSGTNSLAFSYHVAEPDTSPRGIAVPEQTLDLNGGAIRSVDMPTDAHLVIRGGLAHDLGHRVDWRRPPQPPGSPSVTGLAISSEPDTGNSYTLGETIRVTLTFSEAVDVTGNAAPQDQDGPELGGDVGKLRERQRHEQPDFRLHGGGAEHLPAGNRSAGAFAAAQRGRDPLGGHADRRVPGPLGVGPRRQSPGGLAALGGLPAARRLLARGWAPEEAPVPGNGAFGVKWASPGAVVLAIWNSANKP